MGGAVQPIRKPLTGGGPKRLSVLGDSISDSANEWPSIVRAGYNGGATFLYNHAIAAQSVMDHMDAQTVAAANDDADVIIIELGPNDLNNGDMQAFQAECEENIAELKASNPRARIYWMNILPLWTDVGGETEQEKGNLRTAIAAACTAQGITCWDTYTTPWRTLAQTTDGIHSTAEGDAAIATQVLARLP